MTTTNWIGTTSNPALGSNWTNGVPDAGKFAFIGGSNPMNLTGTLSALGFDFSLYTGTLSVPVYTDADGTGLQCFSGGTVTFGAGMTITNHGPAVYMNGGGLLYTNGHPIFIVQVLGSGGFFQLGDDLTIQHLGIADAANSLTLSFDVYKLTINTANSISGGFDLLNGLTMSAFVTVTYLSGAEIHFNPTLDASYFQVGSVVTLPPTTITMPAGNYFKGVNNEKWTFASLDIVSGRFGFTTASTKAIHVTGNMTWTAGDVHFIGGSGGVPTFTVGGNFHADTTDIGATRPWNLAVTGTNTATGTAVQNCNATVTALTVTGGADGGSNTNVIFIAGPSTSDGLCVGRGYSSGISTLNLSSNSRAIGRGVGIAQSILGLTSNSLCVGRGISRAVMTSGLVSNSLNNGRGRSYAGIILGLISNSLCVGRGIISSSSMLDTTFISVDTTHEDGVFTVGEEFEITLTWPYIVYVTGQPILGIDLDQGSGIAYYESGSGTDTLVLRFVAEGGKTTASLAYSGVDALSLNSGTIKLADGSDAPLLLPIPGEAGSLDDASDIALVDYGVNTTTHDAAQSRLVTAFQQANVAVAALIAQSVWIDRVLTGDKDGYIHELHRGRLPAVELFQERDSWDQKSLDNGIVTSTWRIRVHVGHSNQVQAESAARAILYAGLINVRASNYFKIGGDTVNKFDSSALGHFLETVITVEHVMERDTYGTSQSPTTLPGAPPAGIGGVTLDIPYNVASPVTTFDLNINTMVDSVEILVLEAFDDGAATVTVGVDGEQGRYMAGDESIIQELDAIWEKDQSDVGPQLIKVWVHPGSSTAGLIRVTITTTDV